MPEVPAEESFAPKGPENVDELDRKIIGFLREDARQPVAALAEKLGLSATAIGRRLTRLEKQEIIRRYTVILDHGRIGESLEAYVELDFSPEVDVHSFLKEVVKLSTVREGAMLAGRPDAIVRLRVKDIKQLHEVVTELQHKGLKRTGPHGREGLTGIKTLVVLHRERHALELGGEGPDDD